ncbi:MAG: hypothetical protein WCC12_15780 [Anaerolineales bacterium]
MKVRTYAGPLGILAAGLAGVSLLCSVSALAISDLNSRAPGALEPPNIVELAVDNLNTAAALTQQNMTQFVPSETTFPTHTATLTPRPSTTSTVFPTSTPLQPTHTRRPRLASPPTQTNTSIPPTSTPVPPTDTPVSPTPIPDTDTPAPPPSEPPVLESAASPN